MTKQVLFEEDGAFRVGTILSEAGNAFQVEAAHGKRSKIKANAILLRFDGQPLASFMASAQELAAPIDPAFLWEVCAPGTEFGFEDLAREYFGRAPHPQESAAVALALHAHPMYFYRRGKGRYQAAPGESLKAALAGQDKKRRQQEQVDAWAAELGQGRVPEPIGARIDTLLFKPDKMSLEWRALDQAATARGMTPQRVLAAAGALSGPEDYLLRRFAFELFPRGIGFPEVAPVTMPDAPGEASARAFSIDDIETTEIDDAFSVERLDAATLRVGVHIAAPSLFFGRDHGLEAIARERLSTVYFPGGKITMLPAEAVRAASLAEGQRVPAASLYLTVDATSHEVRDAQSRLEWVHIADNLRLEALDTRLNAESVAAGRIEGAHGADLLDLYKLARALKVLRGAGDEKSDRLDYTIRVTEGRVSIVPRARGTPVDMLVSELMIHVNSTWGKQLATAGYPAIYRNQRGGKTRMDVEPGAHEWLGVTHYAWSSSPLRRFSDLANQRQLAALLRGDPPAYTRDELATAAREFEAAYDAYAEHQRLLERYWCLRYLLQEDIREADATVVRDELVRIEGLPMVCRVIGMPGLAPGERVRVAFGEVDLWEVAVLCRFAGKSPIIQDHVAET
ncbi:MAG TPA: RNB domain-containing ribonuclease [Usitatibacter sp.]|jgi:exoribonuclease-2|nr:RNB domain-containing ribonuclease [Usitatibacter sp.]